MTLPSVDMAAASGVVALPVDPTELVGYFNLNPSTHQSGEGSAYYDGSPLRSRYAASAVGSPCLTGTKTTIVTAALRATGLIAKTVPNGATSVLQFRAYVIDTLAPVHQGGDTVIRDNYNTHAAAGVREAARLWTHKFGLAGVSVIPLSGRRTGWTSFG